MINLFFHSGDAENHLICLMFKVIFNSLLRRLLGILNSENSKRILYIYTICHTKNVHKHNQLRSYKIHKPELLTGPDIQNQHDPLNGIIRPNLTRTIIQFSDWRLDA